MSQILTVCSFTLKDALRKKAFRVSSIILLALILILCLIPRFMGNSSSLSESADTTGFSDSAGSADSASSTVQTFSYSAVCFFIDETGLIENAGEALMESFPDTRILPVSAENLDEYLGYVEESGINSIVMVTGSGGMPMITVVVRDFMSGISAEGVSDALSRAYSEQVLLSQGVSPEIILASQVKLPYTVETAGSTEPSGYVLGIVLTMLIFFAVYFYGYGVAGSVATEKTTRVMESLVVSAKPSRILAGKCIAMGLLGLIQFAGALLFGAVCYKLLVPEGFMLFGIPLSFTAFTPASALLILAYFLLGYTLYAMMNAVCGATVSKIEDLNSAMMPVMLIALISFYFAYFSALVSSGDSIMQKIILYVPFTAPFAIPYRLLTSGIPAADIAISILLLLAAIVVISWFSMRIYSASVLNYGQRIKFRDLFRTKVS